MKVEEHIAPAEHATQTGRSKVIIRSTKDTSVSTAVQQCMEACDWESWVPRNGTVVLKPNVCTAVQDIAAVANTGVEVTAAVCEVLLTRTRRIFVGESNHMRQNAWQAFAAAGYDGMAKRLGVTLVCFSEQETVPCDCEPVGPIPLPRMILEADAFITVPVLKTHALTHFTGSLKNQWGCVPNYLDRIHNHTHIHELLPELHRIFKPKMSLMDGILTMEGRGPVAGNTRKLDLILASRDGVALDTTAMRLVGLDPSRCRHVMLAGERRLGNTAAEQIVVDGDWARHATQFERPPRDIANSAMFYMGQYRWFVKYILGNDRIYNPVRDLVKFLRRKKVLGG
ncbi:MAG: DUF362 domain-containing protein [Terriglobales bacterium]